MSVSSEHIEEYLSRVGAKLRAAREAKGIGLGELSSNTRIGRSYLEAIEAGDLSRLPATPFIRGFIRNIAAAVDLPEADLFQEMQALRPQTTADTPVLEPPQEVDTRALITISMWRVALGGLILIVIGWGGYLLLTTGGESPQQTATQSAPSPFAQPAAPVETVDDEADPSAPPETMLQTSASTQTTDTQVKETGTGPGISNPGAAQQQTLSSDPPQPLQLTLQARDRAWVRLSVDRGEPVDVQLQAAESAAWDANEEFRVTIGKSDSVSVYLNGEEIILTEEQNLLIPELVLNRLTLLTLEN